MTEEELAVGNRIDCMHKTSHADPCRPVANVAVDHPVGMRLPYPARRKTATSAPAFKESTIGSLIA